MTVGLIMQMDNTYINYLLIVLLLYKKLGSGNSTVWVILQVLPHNLRV